jgi:hypothetical protein
MNTMVLKITQFALLIKYYYDDKVKHDEMGKTCSTRGDKSAKELQSKNLKGRDDSEELDVGLYAGIILKQIAKNKLRSCGLDGTGSG